jgi:hypothetical protein
MLRCVHLEARGIDAAMAILYMCTEDCVHKWLSMSLARVAAQMRAARLQLPELRTMSLVCPSSRRLGKLCDSERN